MAITNDPNTLHILKASVIAPSRGGKTTTLVSNIQSIQNAIKPPFAIDASEENTQNRVERYNKELEEAIARGTLGYETGIKGTSGVEDFKFTLLHNSIPRLQFHILDFPGGILSSEGKGVGENYKRVTSHLRKSSIVIVPFNATYVAEARSDAEVRRMRELTEQEAVCSFIRDWVNERQQAEDKYTFLAFVPVQCESYLGKSLGQDKSKMLYERFSKQFGPLVDEVSDRLPFCHIRYAPLESLGCVRRTSFSWDGGNGWPKAVYKSEEPHIREVRGAEAVSAVLLQYAVERIERLDSIEMDALLRYYDEKWRSYKVAFLNGILPWRRATWERRKAILREKAERIEPLRESLAELVAKSINPYVRDLHRI